MIVNLVFIGIFATTIFAITSIIGRFLIIKVENAYHFYIYQTIASFIVLSILNICLLFFNGLDTSLAIQHIIVIIFSSIFAFFGFVALFRGFEIGDVSVGGVFLASRIIITIPFGFFIFNEQYPLITYLFILITLLGTILVSFQKNTSLIRILSFRASGSNWFVITLIFWAIANSLIRGLNNEVDNIYFLLIRAGIFIILALITFPLFRKAFGEKNDRGNYLKMKRTKEIFIFTFIYVLILLVAQFSFIYVLGENLTLAETIGIGEGVFTFVFVTFLGLTKTKFFQKYLYEPTDKKTLSLRTIGVILAFFGTFGAILQISS